MKRHLVDPGGVEARREAGVCGIDAEASVRRVLDGGLRLANRILHPRASRSVTVVAPRPDLTPTAILYTSADLVRGRAVLFDSGVQNLKPVGSGNFNIKWFVDGVQVGYGPHTAVPGNTTILNGNSSFTWTAVAGTHTLTFSLDVDNQVAESNETNNSRAVTVTVP